MNLLTLLAAISTGTLVSLLIQVVVVGLIVWLLMWAVGYVGLPEPFNKIAKVIIVLIAVIFLINILLTLIGSPLFEFSR